jgi:CubicO group peptidase (beta-lactamase class C family)
MIKQTVTALLLVTAAAAATAQVKHPVITPSTPAAAGMSTTRLQRIDSMVNNAIASHYTNGGQVLILHDGKIAYYKSFGYNDIEQKTAMPQDGIFRIASQTKAITSTAIMMLYEEGKLLLDDPVSKYIPTFKNPQVLDKYNPADTTYTTIPADKEITIRHLLTHTSGISYAQIGGGPMNTIYAKNHILCGLGLEYKTLGDDMKRLGTLPLLHNPGEHFTYGLNIDVLGYIVEIASGMPLDVFFRTRIFEPLGMKDTYFYLPENKQNRLVNLYIVNEDGSLRKSPGYFEVNNNIMKDYPKAKGTYFAGGAGLTSTIMDYAIFLQTMLNGGEYNGKRILSPASVRLMTMNQIGGLNSGHHKFGLGFQVVTDESSAWGPLRPGSFSWGGAFSTTYWVDPKEKIIGLFYRQLWDDQHEDELINKFKILVYQAINE